MRIFVQYHLPGGASGEDGRHAKKIAKGICIICRRLFLEHTPNKLRPGSISCAFNGINISQSRRTDLSAFGGLYKKTICE
jgi:hypothetical protein